MNDDDDEGLDVVGDDGERCLDVVGDDEDSVLDEITGIGPRKGGKVRKGGGEAAERWVEEGVRLWKFPRKIARFWPNESIPVPNFRRNL